MFIAECFSFPEGSESDCFCRLDGAARKLRANDAMGAGGLGLGCVLEPAPIFYKNGTPTNSDAGPRLSAKCRKSVSKTPKFEANERDTYFSAHPGATANGRRGPDGASAAERRREPGSSPFHHKPRSRSHHEPRARRRERPW